MVKTVGVLLCLLLAPWITLAESTHVFSEKCVELEKTFKALRCAILVFELKPEDGIVYGYYIGESKKGTPDNPNDLPPLSIGQIDIFLSPMLRDHSRVSTVYVEEVISEFYKKIYREAGYIYSYYVPVSSSRQLIGFVVINFGEKHYTETDKMLKSVQALSQEIATRQAELLGSRAVGFPEGQTMYEAAIDDQTKFSFKPENNVLLQALILLAVCGLASVVSQSIHAKPGTRWHVSLVRSLFVGAIGTPLLMTYSSNWKLILPAVGVLAFLSEEVLKRVKENSGLVLGRILSQVGRGEIAPGEMEKARAIMEELKQEKEAKAQKKPRRTSNPKKDEEP